MSTPLTDLTSTAHAAITALSKALPTIAQGIEEDCARLEKRHDAQTLEIELLNKSLYKLRRNWAESLAEDYATNPAKVARDCDEKYDRTGILLGILRPLGQAILTKRLDQPSIVE